MDLQTLASKIKQASYQIAKADSTTKNRLLSEIIQQLASDTDNILQANQLDLKQAKENGMADGLLDRMMINQDRMNQILEGIKKVIALEDPIDEITNLHTTPNGLKIGQMRVPLGVVGMIYEARPNVTIDASVLCLKAGNAVFLRGSKDILKTNQAMVKSMQKAVSICGFDPSIVSLLEDTSHACAEEFMQLNGYLDVLIPRGGQGLIKHTILHATVPVIETGTGNCHVYVDEYADLKKALDIIINAKTSRTSVCNACESVLVHTSVPTSFLDELIEALLKKGVKIHADDVICNKHPDCIKRTEEDDYKEYLAMEISIKLIDSMEDAIAHINRCSTHHSETIVTENLAHASAFLKQIDSACVYVNASTRFSDGFEFGLGAEIGISTQKLHARGPMGLSALTTQKYIILGDGQIRQ